MANKIRRCESCGKISKGKMGEYVRKDGSAGYIAVRADEETGVERETCSDCEEKEWAVEAKDFYVLGQDGNSGELIRCTDKGAAEVEYSSMHMSTCKRIARTTRATTEDKALAWFEGDITVHRRDSRYNVGV